MPRILRLVPTGDFSLILSVLPLHKDTLWMPQISPAVAPFLHRSVERCRLTWNVKHLCESPTENIGTVDAFIHGDILDGDKGTDVHRSGPRMLSCVTNTHTYLLISSQPCLRTSLTRVFAHVDKGEGLPGGVQRPLHHVLRGPDKGVDGSVGGGSGVHVQQAAAGGITDRRGDGIDDLRYAKRDDFQ